MKKIYIFLTLILFFQVNAARAGFYKPPEPDKYEGDKPYTPTRLEWLTVFNQNECGMFLNGIPTVSWGLFNVNGTKDTITIIVRFTDESVRTDAQQAAESCERNIRATTKDRGWAWIKTIPFEEADEKLQKMLLELRASYPSEYNEPVPKASKSDESVIASHTLIPQAMFHAFAEFSVLMSPDLPLKRRQHEMIATMVSVTNDCFY